MIEVFCTRNLKEIDHQMALQEGIKIEDKNFIRLLPIVDHGLQEQISRQLNFPDQCLLFTSKNAVRFAFQNYFQSFSKEVINTWKFYCISGATREALLKYICPNQILGNADYAKDLALSVAKQKWRTPIHFFCGNLRRNVLPDFMKSNKIPFKEWVIYKTIANPIQIPDLFQGYIFYSPSAVKSFLSVNTIRSDKPCFVIGQTTALALKKLVKNPLWISDRTNTPQLLNLLFNYFKNEYGSTQK